MLRQTLYLKCNSTKNHCVIYQKQGQRGSGKVQREMWPLPVLKLHRIWSSKTGEKTAFEISKTWQCWEYSNTEYELPTKQEKYGKQQTSRINVWDTDSWLGEGQGERQQQEMEQCCGRSYPCSRDKGNFWESHPSHAVWGLWWGQANQELFSGMDWKGLMVSGQLQQLSKRG